MTSVFFEVLLPHTNIELDPEVIGIVAYICVTAEEMRRKAWTAEEDAILWQREAGTGWDHIMSQLSERTRQAAHVRYSVLRRATHDSDDEPVKSEPTNPTSRTVPQHADTGPQTKAKSTTRGLTKSNTKKSSERSGKEPVKPTVRERAKSTTREPDQSLNSLSAPKPKTRNPDSSDRAESNQDGSMIDGWSLNDIRKVIRFRDDDKSFRDIANRLPGREIEECRRIYFEYVDKVDPYGFTRMGTLAGADMDEVDESEEVQSAAEDASHATPTVQKSILHASKWSAELQTSPWTPAEDARIWKLSRKGFTRREIAENFADRPILETMRRVAVLRQESQDETFSGKNPVVKSKRQHLTKDSGPSASDATAVESEANTDFNVRPVPAREMFILGTDCNQQIPRKRSRPDDPGPPKQGGLLGGGRFMQTAIQYKSPYAQVSQTIFGDKENQLVENTNNQYRPLQLPRSTIYPGGAVNVKLPYGEGLRPNDNENAANFQKLPGYRPEPAFYGKIPQQLQEITKDEPTWVKLNARMTVPGTGCYKIKSSQVSTARRSVEKTNGRKQDIRSSQELSRMLPRLNPETNIFKPKIPQSSNSPHTEDQRTVRQSNFELKGQASEEVKSPSDAESCSHTGALILLKERLKGNDANISLASPYSPLFHSPLTNLHADTEPYVSDAMPESPHKRIRSTMPNHPEVNIQQLQEDHTDNQSLPSLTPEVSNKDQNTTPQTQSSSTESTLSELSDLSDPPSDIEQVLSYPQDGEVTLMTTSNSQDSENLTDIHVSRLGGRKVSKTTRNKRGKPSRPGISKDARTTARIQKSHNGVTARRKRSQVEDEVISSDSGKFSNVLEMVMDN